MSGLEVRGRIAASGVSMADVARQLDITPQALNSRLKAAEVKASTLQEIGKIINIDLYAIDQQNASGSFVHESTINYQHQSIKTQNSLVIKDFERRLKEKDEVIEAQRKTIQALEQLLASKGN